MKQVNKNNIITLEIDINDVNIIIKSLSDRPFKEVYDLIGKIHAQSNTQLKKFEKNT